MIELLIYESIPGARSQVPENSFLFLFFKIILLLFNYSCLHLLPHHFPQLQPSPPPSPIPQPLAFVHVSLIVVPENPSPFSPHHPLPPPLGLLSDCSQFQCLWLHFVCFFVLLIRFHLEVRSYGICLSPPGLFHLA